MRHRLAQLVTLALRPHLGLVPAVILERSEGSERDYESKTYRPPQCTKRTSFAEGNIMRGARVEEAVLPASLVRIGKRAFAESGIATLRVPEGVREIGEEAFMDCGQLYRATLPASLTAGNLRIPYKASA